MSCPYHPAFHGSGYLSHPHHSHLRSAYPRPAAVGSHFPFGGEFDFQPRHGHRASPPGFDIESLMAAHGHTSSPSYRHEHPHVDHLQRAPRHDRDYELEEEERVLAARLAELRSLRSREREGSEAAEARSRARIEAEAIRQYEAEERAYRVAAAAEVRAAAQAEAEARERAKIAERVARAQALRKRENEVQLAREAVAREDRQERERQAEMIAIIARAHAEQEKANAQAKAQQEMVRARAHAQEVQRQAILRAREAQAQAQAQSQAHATHQHGHRQRQERQQLFDMFFPPETQEKVRGGCEAAGRVLRAKAEEELKRRVFGMWSGAAVAEEEIAKQKEASKGPSVHFATPPTASASASAKPAPTPASASSESEHLKGVAEFLQQAFGIKVSFEDESASGPEETPAQARESPVTKAPAPALATKAEEPRATSPTGQSAGHDNHQDQFADFMKQIFAHATKAEGSSTTDKQQTAQQALPGFLGDLVSAFGGAFQDEAENKPSTEEVKGKGKEREVIPRQDEAESSSAGAWAGLTAQEKEESKAIERSFERKKPEEQASMEAASKVAQPPAPVTLPAKAEQPVAVAEDEAKPAETLRSAYNRNANRVDRLEQLEKLASKLDKLAKGFTFPATLDFQSPTSSAPSSPSLDPVESAAAARKPHLRVPALTFSHNNQVYHSQAQGLMQLLTEADAIPSEGDKQVRQARKEFVKQVEAELGRMEVQRGDIWRAQSQAAEARAEEQSAVPEHATGIPGEEFEQPATPAEEVKGSPLDTVAGYTLPTDADAHATPAEVIFEAPASPEVAHASLPEVDAVKADRVTTVEDVPEEVKPAVDQENYDSKLPAISTISPLPAAEASAVAVQSAEAEAEPETEESTRSFSSSDDSDSDSEVKNPKKMDEEFVML